MHHEPAGQPETSDGAPPGRWRATLLVGGVVFGLYLLLLNPWWTPGGDSELFLAAARSIVRGEGYTYNGKAVAIAPPAWAYTLAGVMRVSPTFLLIKLVTLSLMALAAVFAHRVLLRLGPARWAAWATVLGFILVPAYSLTFWLHSEPMFCALAWAAMLMAVRVAEDTSRAGSLLALILLCAAMAGVRWTSGLQWGLIAAVLASGWSWPRGRTLLSRPTGPSVHAGIGLSGLVTVLVFLLFYLGLPAVAEAISLPAELPVTKQDAEDETPQLVDNTIFRNLSPLEERLRRLTAAGHWPAWALWYPLRFAGGVAALSWMSLAVGWLVLGMLALAAWRALAARGGDIARWPRGRFLWPALLAYVMLLVLIWPLPNARYLVPAAPLLVMGVLWGCASLGEILRRPLLGRILGAAFLVSVLIVNGAMLAADVAVQRSGDALFGGSPRRYYATYEAGLHESLLRAVAHLREQGVADNEVAVSERYFNLNRMRFSKGGPRNAVMLLDRQVIAPPDVYSFIPTQIPPRLYHRRRVLPGGFAEWASLHDPPIRYFLYQQPSEPWRLWHFRVPTGLQQRLTGAAPGEPTFGWLLFSSEDGFRQPVALPAEYEGPRRIPGL